MSGFEQGEDRAFEERLRAGLHAAAAEVEPDPAGWRQLNAQIRRRRAYGWGGGLALAGAAVALVAVFVLPGDGPRVEFAPPNPDGGVATQPATAPEATAPTPGEEGSVPAPAGGVAGGIVYSDGDSIHVADLDGQVQFTPSQGDGTSTITDLAVRPGGTTDDFTMAYRFEVTDDSPEQCATITWEHVGGADDVPPGGTLPWRAPGDCVGAPVFASDGSALAWLAETANGEVQLQAVDWPDEGPMHDPQLHTFSLDSPLSQAGLTDPALLDWTVEPTTDGSSDFPAVGVLVIRAAGDSGLSTYVMTGERRSDGGFTTAPLVPSLGELVDDSGIGGTIIEAHRGWRLVRLPTGDAEERVGLATPARQRDGEEVPPLTVETELLLDVDARPFLDAMGDTAILGVGDGDGDAMVLAQVGAGDADNPGSVAMNGNLPPATTAALLAQPGAVSPDRDASTVDPSVTSTPSPAATSTSSPTVPPVSVPTPTDAPTDAPQEVPAAVRSTAAAIRDAALARDYASLATLIPGDGFTSNFGGSSDHIAYYQQEEANGIDVLGTLADLLAADPVRQPGTDLWVWPEAYLQDGYLGYRVGITDAGTWQFYVAGD